MHWLLSAILIEFGFAQLFKWSQRRGYNAPVVVSTNYLTLASLLFIYLASTEQLALITPGAIKVGLITGTVFICSLSLMTGALERARVSAVITAFRMSIIVPVFLGVWLWHEPVSPVQIGGIGLALLALFLMTSGAEAHPHRITGLKAFALILAVLCCQGLSQSCLRWVQYAGLNDNLLGVILVVGTTAGTLGCLVILIKGKRPTRPELLMGGGIGLFNCIGLVVVLTALSRIPGTIYFPILGCAVAILDNFFAHFHWKERLTRPAIAGAVLAVFSLSLVI